MIEWGDLRFLLAVAREGSASRAANALGVDQTTVIRRIAHLEQTIGSELVERRQSGYRLTDMGRRVAEAAERIDVEVINLENAVEASKRSLAGSIRFTSSERITNFVIAPWLAEFRRLHPDISIELIGSDRYLDVGGGEADVAIRMPARPEGAGIVVRRLPDIAWSVYCSRSYGEENGLPRSPEAIPGHAVIGAPPDATATNAAWLEEIAGKENVAVRCGSISSILGSARAGLGLAVLPCVLADTAPELVQCMPPLTGMTSQIWMIIREDLKAAPHVRAFTDFLAEHMRDERDRLSGQSRSDG